MQHQNGNNFGFDNGNLGFDGGYQNGQGGFQSPANFQRGNGGQQQSRKQQLQDEPVVAWLNIRFTLGSGEVKQLGKGIPLRESVPLERAILDLMEDEDFDANQLKGAIDIRVNSSTDNKEDVQIDLLGALKTDSSAPATKAKAPRKPRTRNPQNEDEE